MLLLFGLFCFFLRLLLFDLLELLSDRGFLFRGSFRAFRAGQGVFAGRGKPGRILFLLRLLFPAWGKFSVAVLLGRGSADTEIVLKAAYLK